MKIKLWTKYDVGYLPTNRCRKLRYKEQEEYIEVELKEVSKTNFELAFDTGLLIYSYNNRLWREATENDIHCKNTNNPMTAIEALIYSGVTYSTYFGRYKDYIKDSLREGREEVITRAENDMNEYLLVDGKLYTTTSEPMYCIYTFGLGHNHAGIGTSLSINGRYNPNISKERYFNALEYDKALNKALEIALNRGDTDSLDYIKNCQKIEVFNDKFVTRNPQIEHCEGNEFINSIERMIDTTSSSVEAGILIMAVSL